MATEVGEGWDSTGVDGAFTGTTGVTGDVVVTVGGWVTDDVLDPVVDNAFDGDGVSPWFDAGFEDTAVVLGDDDRDVVRLTVETGMRACVDDRGGTYIRSSEGPPRTMPRSIIELVAKSIVKIKWA